MNLYSFSILKFHQNVTVSTELSTVYQEQTEDRVFTDLRNLERFRQLADNEDESTFKKPTYEQT